MLRVFIGNPPVFCEEETKQTRRRVGALWEMGGNSFNTKHPSIRRRSLVSTPSNICWASTPHMRQGRHYDTVISLCHPSIRPDSLMPMPCNFTLGPTRDDNIISFLRRLRYITVCNPELFSAFLLSEPNDIVIPSSPAQLT